MPRKGRHRAKTGAGKGDQRSQIRPHLPAAPDFFGKRGVAERADDAAHDPELDAAKPLAHFEHRAALLLVEAHRPARVVPARQPESI